MDSTFERICTILLKDKTLAVEQLQPDTRLEDLRIDSLGMALLFFDAESEFGISFPTTAVSLTTLADVVRYVDQLVAEQNAAAGPGDAAARQ